MAQGGAASPRPRQSYRGRAPASPACAPFDQSEQLPPTRALSRPQAQPPRPLSRSVQPRTRLARRLSSFRSAGRARASTRPSVQDLQASFHAALNQGTTRGRQVHGILQAACGVDFTERVRLSRVIPRQMSPNGAPGRGKSAQRRMLVLKMRSTTSLELKLEGK